MAEARQAVGFRFHVTHDGALEVDYDAEVVKLIWASARRTWRRRLARVLNSIKNLVFPLRPEALAAATAVLTSIHLAGVDLGVTKVALEMLNV